MTMSGFRRGAVRGSSFAQVRVAVVLGLVVPLFGLPVSGALGTESTSAEVCNFAVSTGVSGTVTELGSGSPVAGAWVEVLRTSDSSIAGGGIANGSGDFSAEVAAGSYNLYVIDPSGTHAAGLFGAPTTVTVTSGAMVDADPAMAPTGGSVTATVTETGTGTPIGGVWGLALSASVANTGATEAAVVADGSGELTLPRLRPGNHYVGYIDPTGAHSTRFFPNSPNLPDATPVAVTAGNATAANASLPAQTLVGTGSVISGTVTEAGTNTPLANARVLALRAADYQIVRAAATNASGQYSLDLAAGDYKLAFLDASGGHDMEWFDNLPSTGLPSAVSVTAPGTANAALDANTGTMAGTVTDDTTTTPVGCAWVIAIGPTGIAGGVVTEPDGTYTLAGLTPGTYRAQFVDPNGGRTQEYFDDSPTYPGAATLNITAATTTTIDAALANPAAQPPAFLNAWGDPGDSQFDNPQGTAVDGTGNVYVADSYNHRVQKFSPTGTYLTQWGTLGSGDGQFRSPSGVAVGPSGDVYVADSNNHRVQKFSSTGAYLAQWGTQGSGNGQFAYPDGVAVDGNGNVYVADRNNNRVQKFSSTGAYLAQWGTQGSGNGQFAYPDGVAVDGNGNVYVADRDNNRVQKFSSTGTYLTQWGTQGSGNGQFAYPDGVAVDGNGNVYVADRNNNRIQKFSSTGTYLTKWGASARVGNGQFNNPWGVAVGPSGDVFVADRDNDRIQKFSSTGTYLAQWGSRGSGNGQFGSLNGVAVDDAGNVYAADSGNSRVQKFTSTGTYLTKWGTQGSGNGQFSLFGLAGLAVDRSGDVYVSDAFGQRIQKFTSTGTYLTQWGTGGTGNGQFNRPSGVAVGPSGDVHVVDSRNHRVQVFTSTGSYLRQWGAGGYGNGQFNWPRDIAVDDAGNVYVADGGNNRVQVFTSTGGYLTQWGTYGNGNGQFNSPRGVAVGPSGDVYVADTDNDRVQRFG